MPAMGADFRNRIKDALLNAMPEYNRSEDGGETVLELGERVALQRQKENGNV